MSANNQTLIKEYNGKWYVFADIMAESWSKKNELNLKSANAVFDSRDVAFTFALEIDKKQGQFGEGTEYGVQFNRFCKDDTNVLLV